VFTTIRAKFAAVLSIGLTVIGAAVYGLVDAPNRAVLFEAAQPALLVGLIVTLSVMLLIERVVINPIANLTKSIVAIAGGGTRGGVCERLPANGSDEISILARTFNGLLETLDAKQKLEAQLVHMAHHDALTELPNRVLFRQNLERELTRARRGGELAVLCLDLDQFKSVNDTLGHPVGDGLLRAVADRMRESVREMDVIARLGGDEFAIVQVGAKQPEAAIVLAERLIAAMSRPFEIAGHQVVVGTSIGVAIAPSDGDETEQLIKSADMALYRAKSDGRGIFRFFEPEMDAKMQARRTLELDLRKALLVSEFEIYYQPLINLQSNQVCGFEALLRWHHPSRGLVSPCDFIPAAEDMGLIVPLGEWVLRKACAEAASWPEHIKVAVNLSPAQFKSKGLALAVTSALADSGLSPHRLELEITESVLLLESETTLVTLHQLRDLGVKISMDDFGTGYSSLSYLRSFPFDKIKIDRSFVRDLSDREDSIAIVRAVSGLGRNLGMSTTAEGVETAEQLGQLRGEGCTEVQGYYFSQPTPAEEILSVIEKVRTQLGCKDGPPLPLSVVSAKRVA
jgi:diguanylate cyclase (GGDEF)-like protein